MKSCTFVFLGLLSTASLYADIDLSKLPPPAKQQGLTYAKDIKPVLEGSCFGCHGADRQKGGLRLDSLEAALKGGEGGKVIIAKDSAKSLLIHAVSQLDPDTAMPPKQGPGRPGGRGPGGPGFGSGGPLPGGPGQPPPQGERRQPGPPPGSSGPGGSGGKGFGAPPKPLSAEQVSLLRAWIDQGAR